MSKKRYHSFVSPYLMWFLVVCGSVISFTYFSFNHILDPHPALYIAAGVALSYWMYFFTKGVTSNLQASFRPHHVSNIVTTGIYAKVRHPIYSADIVLAWGFFLVYPMTAIFLAVVWTTVVLMVWVYLEEKALHDIFGAEYTEYQKRVPMIFPLKRI